MLLLYIKFIMLVSECIVMCCVWLWRTLARIFFNNGTMPESVLFPTVQGGCQFYISFVSSCPVFCAAFRLSWATVEFLSLAVTLCSEMCFGCLRELLLSSYQHCLMLWAAFQPSWARVELFWSQIYVIKTVLVSTDLFADFMQGFRRSTV